MAGKDQSGIRKIVFREEYFVTSSNGSPAIRSISHSVGSERDRSGFFMQGFF